MISVSGWVRKQECTGEIWSVCIHESTTTISVSNGVKKHCGVFSYTRVHAPVENVTSKYQLLHLGNSNPAALASLCCVPFPDQGNETTTIQGKGAFLPLPSAQ